VTQLLCSISISQTSQISASGLIQKKTRRFVRTLTQPAKGRDQSLLRQITHLKISGLRDITSVEILLSHLTSLTSLNLSNIYFSEEWLIFDKLIDSWAKRPSSTTTSGPLVDIPKVFCPKLEKISTKGLNSKSMKVLIIARRNAGAPLKRDIARV
jgi:hypothetical protein